MRRDEPVTSECILGRQAADEAEVGEWAQRAAAAGGTIVAAPGAQPWGYVATVADPTATAG